MRALACGPAAARLRADGARERAFGSRFASAFGRAARPQRYARLPPAPRSARVLRPSASGAALSQPAPSTRPVAAPTFCALRPASLPPIGSTPSTPALAVQAPTGSSGAWGDGADHGRVPHGAPAPRRHPCRRPTGRAARPHEPRPVPSAGGLHANEGCRPRWRPIPTPPRTTCGGTPRASRARRRPPPCPGASRRPCPARSSRRRSPRRRPRREAPRP